MSLFRWNLAIPAIVLSTAFVHAGEGDTHFGKPLRHWLDGVESKDAKARDEALAMLVKIGRPARAAIPALKALIKDASASTRFKAALALWAVGGDGKDAWPVVRGMVKSLTLAQKYQVVGLVEFLKPIDEHYLDALLEFQKDRFATGAAQLALYRLNDSAIPAYEKFLDAHADNKTAALAMVPYRLVQSSKGKLLAKYLKDADDNVRMTAAAQLVMVPETKAAALRALLDLSKSPKSAIADRAISSLATVQPPPREAEAIFRQTLAHKDVKMRLAAARPYLQLRPDDLAAALPALRDAFQSADARTRYEAAGVIRLLGPRVEPLVPVFLKVLRESRTASDQYSALCALAPFRERVAKDIVAIVFDPKKDPNRPLSAALRSHAASLTGAVKSHLKGEDPAGRAMAARIAARVLPAAEIATVVPELTAALRSDDARVVKSALHALMLAGTAARPAAGDVLALLDRKDAANLLRPIRETVHEMRPGPKVVEKALRTLDRKEKPTFGERFLAAELASQLPDGGKALASRILPLLRDPGFGRESQAVYQFLNEVGPNLAASVPALREYLEASPGKLEWFGPALIRIGPPARALAPLLLEKAKSAGHTQDALKYTVPLAAVDPARRPEADRKLNQLFLEHLRKYPRGSEVNYFLSLLRDYLDRSGPSKELEPVLFEIFRTRGDARYFLAKHLLDLNPARRAEVLKTLVADLDTPPPNSRPLPTLLKVNPDHPQALKRLTGYLKDPNVLYRRSGAFAAVEAGVNLPAVRPLLESLKADANSDVRLLAAVALMKADKKLDARTVDALFARAEDVCTPGLINFFETVAGLGSLARPLIPRLKALRRDEMSTYRVENVINHIQASK